MAGRIRTLKPELLEDERAAALSSNAFRLFVGCILLADDHGNLRLRLSFIAGAVFWRLMEDGRIAMVDIDAALVELTRPDGRRPGLLTPYQVRGQVYAHVTGWEKHQKVDKPQGHRVPPPTDQDAAAFLIDSVGICVPREQLANPSRLIRDGSPTNDQRPTTNEIPASAGSEPNGSGAAIGSEDRPSQSDPPKPPTHASPAPDARTADPASRPGATDLATLFGGLRPRGAVETVYDTYVEGWRETIRGNRPPVLTDKRKKLIQRHLKEFSVDDLCLACRGIWLLEFNVSTGHYGIDLVLRDAGHIERYRDVALRGVKVPANNAQASRQPQRAQIQENPISERDFLAKLDAQAALTTEDTF